MFYPFLIIFNHIFCIFLSIFSGGTMIWTLMYQCLSTFIKKKATKHVRKGQPSSSRKGNQNWKKLVAHPGKTIKLTVPTPPPISRFKKFLSNFATNISILKTSQVICFQFLDLKISRAKLPPMNLNQNGHYIQTGYKSGFFS